MDIVLAMRKGFLNFLLMTVAVVAFGLMVLASTCLAQPQHRLSSDQVNSLKKFLQNYVGNSDDDRTTEYSSAFVDLRDDGTQDVIVYLTGDGWCGSGGCTTLILVPKDSSYEVVTKITIVRPPIRILVTKLNGWHDIAVRVQGGGIIKAYEAKLSFNGRTYPRNPSVPPARRLVEKVAGEEVVPITALIEKGTPLY
jgi:hypothetical protein